MGGGLMQLVAYGAQDIYLTGNPQITFFKVVYRRHTNFSMEAIEQTWNGNVASSNRVTATISRNGDLVHRMFLEHNPGATDTAVKNYGHSIISDVELEIGGQKIDKQTGTWMETWAQLTELNVQRTEQSIAAADGTLFQKLSGAGGTLATTSNGMIKIYVPLQFWFCRNPGLSLPLIALQYHEVKVVLNIGDIVAGTIKLWVDYIYLDTDERRRFAQVSHEYLIEQVQEQSFTGDSNGKTNDLNFNHPVKELIVSGANTTMASPITTAGTTMGLKLNGHERFAVQDWKYFSRAQVWQYHSGFGGVTVDSGIGVYSFALKPEEHQPSGTCNFSRIDNAQLYFSANPDAAGTIFAVNYNVLRIMSGMGGLAYSN